MRVKKAFPLPVAPMTLSVPKTVEEQFSDGASLTEGLSGRAAIDSHDQNRPPEIRCFPTAASARNRLPKDPYEYETSHF
jgi:hypothetical protein